MQNLRPKCDKSSEKIAFLRLEKINKSLSETQYTKSIEQKKTDNSGELNKNIALKKNGEFNRKF